MPWKTNFFHCTKTPIKSWNIPHTTDILFERYGEPGAKMAQVWRWFIATWLSGFWLCHESIWSWQDNLSLIVHAWWHACGSVCDWLCLLWGCVPCWLFMLAARFWEWICLWICKPLSMPVDVLDSLQPVCVRAHVCRSDWPCLSMWLLFQVPAVPGCSFSASSCLSSQHVSKASLS